MPGLNYAYRSAALIPPKGLVLGAINPANMRRTVIEKNSIAEKRKPSMMPGRTRVVLKTAARTLPVVVVPPPCRMPGPVSSLHLSLGCEAGTLQPASFSSSPGIFKC